MSGCPTCGDHGPYGLAVRVRKGRARLRPRRWWRDQVPQDSLRVYWPPSRWWPNGSVAACPDPYHEGPIPMSRLRPPPAEMSTTVNQRIRPEEANGRRRRRAQRHRDRQSKDRR